MKIKGRERERKRKKERACRRIRKDIRQIEKQPTRVAIFRVNKY